MIMARLMSGHGNNGKIPISVRTKQKTRSNLYPQVNCFQVEIAARFTGNIRDSQQEQEDTKWVFSTSGCVKCQIATKHWMPAHLLWSWYMLPWCGRMIDFSLNWPHTLYSETVWNGGFWSKTMFLKLQN